MRKYFFLFVQNKKELRMLQERFFSSLTFVLYWTFIFFFMPQGSGGFLLKKSCKLTIGTSSFCRNLFPEEWSEKKMVFYIRKTNAIIWYDHLLYQKSKKKSILEKVVFSLNVLFFKNCLHFRMVKFTFFFKSVSKQ